MTSTDTEVAIRIAHVRQETEPIITSNLAMSWQEFCALFERPIIKKEKRNLPCWSPGVFSLQYCANVSCVCITALVMDVDTGADPEVFRRTLAGNAFVIHSSFRHCEGAPRFRVILPLSVPVPVAQWAGFYAAAIGALGRGQADPVCKDERRLYFKPVCPPERKDQYFCWINDGEFLDPSIYLPEPEPDQKPTNGHTNYAPIPRGSEDSLDMESLRTGNVEDGLKHATFIRAIRRLRKEDRAKEYALDFISTTIRSIPAARFSEASHEHVIEKYRREIETEWLTTATDPDFQDGKRVRRTVPHTPEINPETGEILERKKYARDDVGNVERLLDSYSNELRHVYAWRKFLVWDGKRFMVDEKGSSPVFERAKRVVKQMWAEIPSMPDETKEQLDDIAAFKKWISSCHFKTRLDSMVTLTKLDARVAISAEDLDTDPWLFNSASGTIDLKSGTLRPYRQSDLITKLIDIPYDPDAKCPNWTRFLLSIFGGDEDLARFMHRIVGYSLTGDIREHALFFLYGTGANGKSTFVDILMQLMGDYSKRLGADSLMVTRFTNQGGPTPEIAKMKGARLVAVSETSNSGKLDESRVKDLTGGDRITACMKYGDPFEFDPTHKLWLSGNHKPVIDGTDNGIWRRIHIIPFNQTFTDDAPDESHRKDRTLPYRLRSELPGILAWAVRGCLSWQDKGLNPPQSVLDAVAQYRESQDIVGDFLKQMTEQGEHQWIKKADMYAAYKSWALDNGLHPMSAKKFHPELDSRGFKTGETHGVAMYRGIGLPTPQ